MPVGRKRLIFFLPALALIGFVDAAYLTIRHYLGAAPPCLLFNGCETVTTSAYASWGPVPVALVGAIFYLALFVLTLLYLDLKRPRILQSVFILSVLGFSATIYFLAVQAFILKTFCSYCLVSAAVSILIFFLTRAIIRE